jgi:hypothetical protein
MMLKIKPLTFDMNFENQFINFLNSRNVAGWNTKTINIDQLNKAPGAMKLTQPLANATKVIKIKKGAEK